jgi:hypothetical protein
MTTLNKYSFLLLLLIITIQKAHPTNYTVGPDKPYKSLQEVTDLLNEGDTVFVDGDETYTGGVEFTKAGAEDSPIVIRGIRISGNRPALTGGTNTVHFSSPWPYTSGADHYIFEGFDISGGTTRGIFHQADDLTIRDVAVHDCEAHGILGADQGSGSCYLEHVEVYNCGAGDRHHQIYMATDEVNRPGSVFRMQYCYIHDASGGNNVKSRAERNEIYYNWIEGAYYHELELIGPDPGGAPDGWYPRLKREDSDIVGNVLWKKGSNYNFSVTRIGGDATGESHGRYRFVNNTIISGTGAVFRCFDSLQSAEMHNNVFYPAAGNSINMIRMVEATWTEDTAVIVGTNNWFYEEAQNIPSQWKGTVRGTDPGFVNFADNDVTPATGSQLINAGASSVQSPPGYEFPTPLFPPLYHPPMNTVNTSPIARNIKETIDIGAYEFGSTGIITGNKFINNYNIISASPNPFKSSTIISYYLASPGDVTVTIYSCKGIIIDSFYKERQSKGSHSILWDGLIDNKAKIKSGVYILTVKSGTFLRSVRLIKSN